MPRWRQVVNEDGTSRFVRIDEAKTRQRSHAIHGEISRFVSPIDGSVIDDRKQMREHCERHGVVPAQEFSADHYRQKAEERARFFTGESTRQETHQRRQQMWEIANRLERENGR